MTRSGTAATRGGPLGVSAEDLLGAVRVHLDRVHDLVRRLGCDPAAAAEVVESSALDLVTVVAERPETVQDAVGWWIARARDLAVGAATQGTSAPLGGGVLSADDDQQILAAALDELPERDRLPLLLRDSYDLPAESVGTALATDANTAMRRVGNARLAFLTLVDDEPAHRIPAHQEDLASLARLGEAGPVAARDATARRHALSCQACRALTDAQQRAHLLLTGLTVVAVAEADRVAILARVEQASYELLPTSSALHQAWETELALAEEEDPRVLSPLLAVLGVVLAVLAGIGLGLLLSRSPTTDAVAGADGRVPSGVQLLSPSPIPPRADRSPPTVRESPPQTSVFVIPSPEPPPPPPPPPSPAPAVEALAITLSPASGPNGTELTVNGTGWAPDSTVTVDYLDSTGTSTGAQTTTVSDARGRFTAQLVAQDPANLPGPHTVRASNGTQTAEASFDAQA